MLLLTLTPPSAPDPTEVLYLGTVGDTSQISDEGPDSLVGEAGALQMGSVVSDAVIGGGPWLSSPIPVTDTEPDSRVTMGMYQPDNSTFLGLIPVAFDRTWNDTLNQTGNGSFSWPSSVDAPIPELLKRRYVRMMIDGESRFAVQLEHATTTFIDHGEEIDEVKRWTGRGPLSEWERPTVYPTLPYGELPYAEDGTRTFHFASPGYGSNGRYPGTWTLLTSEYVQTQFNGDALHDRPFGWPDPYSQFMWGRPSADGHGPGDCYFVTDFHLTADYTVTAFCSADDNFILYLDGVKLLEGDPPPTANWQKGFWTQVPLKAGWHRLGVVATNYDLTEAFARLGLPPWWPHGNVAGFVAGVWLQGQDTYIDDPIVLTAPSFTNWYCRAYPAEPPGWTAGEIIIKLLGEAQARGLLLDWQLAFNSTTDSAGRPWANIPEFVVNVGDTYLKVVEQLAEAYVDVAAQPAGKVLRMWDKDSGGRGQDLTASVTFANVGDEDTDNLLKLEREL